MWAVDVPATRHYNLLSCADKLSTILEAAPELREVLLSEFGWLAEAPDRRILKA